MKNSTFKLLLMACVMFLASQSYAQFKFTTNTNIGQTLTTNLVDHVNDFVVDFNTAKAASTWSYIDSTSTYSINLSKCQTQKGLQVNIYTADTVGAPKIINGDFECRDYGANRNPVHVTNVDSLMSILTALQNKNAGTGDSLKDVTWNPSACLFDVDGNPADQAFGAHPGMYKVIEYGFQFNFAGTVVSHDITFDMDTYDAGNTGMTASYMLTVATGSASNVIGTVDNFYVTGSGKKSVSLAAAIGVEPSVFSNTKVYIFLKTMGTGTAIAKGTVDPTIVFDNIKASYDLPQWISPAAGVEANVILNNSASPLTGIINEENTFSIHLQTVGRLGTLTVTNDLQDPSVQLFTFPDSMAIMANDGSGKYTVNVPYAVNQSVFDGEKWSKASITVAAPDSGTVNDDLMFYFKATPTSMNPVSARLELNCGTRIWYDVYIKGVEAPTVQEWNISDAAFNGLGTLTAPTTVNGLTVYASADKPVVIDANNKSIDGMDFTSRLKLGGSGLFTDGMPAARVLAFDVTGNTTITIVGMSSSSSADRELTIAAGSKDNVIGTFPAMGASIGKQDFEYVGGATTIYLFSPSSGVNVYYIKAVTPAPGPAKKVAYVTYDKTMAETAVSPANDPVIKMLQADPNFDVTVMNVAADSVFSLAGYDVVVAQEGFSSSAAIFKPGGSLALENIKVPFIYNKAYALKGGKAVTSATAGVSEIPGELYMQVSAASQASKLFTGIAFTSDSIKLFKTGAADDGSAGDVKAYSYATDLEMSDAATLLAKPKGAPDNVSVCINDIPAGTVLGTQDTLKSRMIAISENFGAICKDHGTNLTDEGLTIWRNALYMAAGLEVPTAMIKNSSALDTLFASAGTLSPEFDPTQTSYQLYLPNGTSSVKLTALASSYQAMVSAPGEVAVAEGKDTTLTVVVKNVINNDSTTYQVLVHVIATGLTQLDRMSLAVFPNPATDYVKVRFNLDQKEEVSLYLYSLTGQEIEISKPHILYQGSNEISVNTTNLKSGLYLYRLKVGTGVVSGKLNVLR